MEVFRIVNSEALTLPAVVEVLFSAFAANGRTPEQATAAVEELSRCVSDPRTGLFIGFEGEQFSAVMVIFLPQNPLHNHPQVHLLWSRGSKALTDAITAQGKKFCIANGYHTAWAITRGPGTALEYSRRFANIGKSRPVAAILEFALE